MEAKYAREVPRSFTEPAHDPPEVVTMEQAMATVAAGLPVVETRRYHHAPDGKFLDTQTGEILDKIP